MGKLLPPVLVAQRKDTQLHMLITKEEHAMMKTAGPFRARRSECSGGELG